MMISFHKSYKLFLLLVLVMILPVYASGTEKPLELPLQKTCPVMGGPVNRSLFVDHEGKRIYVCCAGCIEPIKKNPEKYLDLIKKNGERAERIQTECPVMGGKINKDLFADVKGKRIYVCCSGCINIIKKSPEKYINEFAEKGIQLDDTPVEPK
jgi:YHS domain-containing protein